MIKIILLRYILKTIAMFAFTRFYLRVLADLNEIIRRLKRNVIMRIAINTRAISRFLTFYDAIILADWFISDRRKILH